MTAQSYVTPEDISLGSTNVAPDGSPSMSRQPANICSGAANSRNTAELRITSSPSSYGSPSDERRASPTRRSASRQESRGRQRADRARRLCRIEADGTAYPQIIHDVEAALAAFELGNLRLIGAERARHAPLDQARCSTVALEDGDDGAVFAIEFVASGRCPPLASGGPIGQSDTIFDHSRGGRRPWDRTWPKP